MRRFHSGLGVSVFYSIIHSNTPVAGKITQEKRGCQRISPARKNGPGLRRPALEQALHPVELRMGGEEPVGVEGRAARPRPSARRRTSVWPGSRPPPCHQSCRTGRTARWGHVPHTLASSFVVGAERPCSGHNATIEGVVMVRLQSARPARGQPRPFDCAINCFQRTRRATLDSRMSFSFASVSNTSSLRSSAMFEPGKRRRACARRRPVQAQFRDGRSRRSGCRRAAGVRVAAVVAALHNGAPVVNPPGVLGRAPHAGQTRECRWFRSCRSRRWWSRSRPGRRR